MSVRNTRLVLAVFFLLAGVTLLVLRFGMPEAVAKFDKTRLFLGAVLALGLGGVNLMKWYAGWLYARQTATPVRTPLQPGDDAPRGTEYNPEFDFDKKNNSGERPA